MAIAGEGLDSEYMFEKNAKGGLVEWISVVRMEELRIGDGEDLLGMYVCEGLFYAKGKRIWMYRQWTYAFGDTWLCAFLSFRAAYRDVD